MKSKKAELIILIESKMHKLIRENKYNTIPYTHNSNNVLLGTTEEQFLLFIYENA